MANVDQMNIYLAVAKELGKVRPKLPADSRSNVIIAAANMVVSIYDLSNAEFVSRYGEIGQNLPKVGDRRIPEVITWEMKRAFESVYYESGLEMALLAMLRV